MKPATPLPWKVGSVAPGRYPYYPIFDSEWNYVGQVDIHARGGSNIDSAYLVHAANAYPRLVAAIQDDLRGYLGTFPPGHPATKLRDLLSDLGETIMSDLDGRIRTNPDAERELKAAAERTAARTPTLPPDSSCGGSAHGLTALLIERDALAEQAATLLAEKAKLVEALRWTLGLLDKPNGSHSRTYQVRYEHASAIVRDPVVEA